MRAIGLMSGTSCDGVDVALVETNGERIFGFGPTGYRPYAAGERAVLAQALKDAAAITARHERPGAVAEAEAVVTSAHAEAVEDFLARNGLTADDIDVVGFHGQTVLHRPDAGLTVQIGDGPGLARRLQIPVVYDFRAADVAAGGQGAPLAPTIHPVLVAGLDLPRPLGVLNLGGVGNVTFIGAGGELVAFDTGPANALMDDRVESDIGAPFDLDGRIAAGGTVDEAALARLMDDPYFDLAPPKSLDRNAFDAAPTAGLALADALATLAAFTAETVVSAAALLPARPALWLVSGGGARNPTLMRMLKERLGAEVTGADAVGLSADAIEAQAFAVLAVRSLRGLPLTYPGTTGAPRPLTGGVLATP
ncbi:anhydro-N-acetylmuramic acid kinase [Methylopila jiangsuensis]|uniref:Anhydro-N-acetylmuramic acid kinase n=1 Tax=Methylopila jiangsuensis TaxID=586230 RepID=A0A9W6JI07_9HYPH|nr:anhydro-N-acetylmuramic acid kinase [Methylopila jiangsuensis]MDR6286133.1 anhydro-N-acetylmuramic acid kinase [Methylopila jiangsuensis]GLK75893.1 anhydro-N-acetylmuramic acid kinase [Methylopila jiangsuensis]